MSEKKTIYRIVKQRNYAIIDKGFLERKDLSWKAKGILAYLLSLPDDWQIHSDEIATHAKDGITSFYAGMRELVELGYIERNQLYDKDKKFSGLEYLVKERPDPYSGFPHTGFPRTENLTLLNNNITNTDKTKKEKNITKKEIPLNEHLPDETTEQDSKYPDNMTKFTQEVMDKWNSIAEKKIKSDWVLRIPMLIAQLLSNSEILKANDILIAIDNYKEARKLKQTRAGNFTLPNFLKEETVVRYSLKFDIDNFDETKFVDFSAKKNNDSLNAIEEAARSLQ